MYVSACTYCVSSVTVLVVQIRGCGPAGVGGQGRWIGLRAPVLQAVLTACQ